jgi:hypothetical protein
MMIGAYRSTEFHFSMERVRMFFDDTLCVKMSPLFFCVSSVSSRVVCKSSGRRPSGGSGGGSPEWPFDLMSSFP